MGGAGGGGRVELWERMVWVVERKLRVKEGKSIIFQSSNFRRYYSVNHVILVKNPQLLKIVEPIFSFYLKFYDFK